MSVNRAGVDGEEGDVCAGPKSFTLLSKGFSAFCELCACLGSFLSGEGSVGMGSVRGVWGGAR